MSDELRDLSGVQLGYVDCWDDCQQFMSWASERHEMLALDLETCGLDPWAADAGIRLIQVGDTQTGWALPWHRYRGLVEEVVQDYRGPQVWHNVAFDGKHLAVQAPDFHMPWERVQDTMIIARMAEPNKSAALKRLSDELFDRNASIGQKALHTAMADNGWTWGTVPYDFETYTMYSSMDVVLTARLWKHFQPWLKEGENQRNYDLEMAVRRICTAMEVKGFRVDLEYSAKMYDQLTDYVEQIVGWADQAHGLQIGSPQKLLQWIELQGAGDFIKKRTASGNKSTDKDVLKKLSIEPAVPTDVRTVCAETLKARKAEKLAGTYFKNFLSFNREGILHPNINPLAARTSRMSITDPALQTLNKGEATVRDAFIPHNEDELLVTCDSDQIEARLFANFSQDPAFQAAFGSGDFFVNLAREVYQDPTLQKSDPRRPTIKTYMYSKLYGAGVPKMALSAGVPEAAMRAVDSSMNDRFPGIKRFQEAVTTHAMRTGRVLTPLGRELKIEDSSKAYVATNYTLQGHAAELLKLALINADHSGISQYMLVPVHDEIVCSVPKDLAADVARTLEECMTFTDPDLYPVPITASAEGPFTRWGDKLRENK